MTLAKTLTQHREAANLAIGKTSKALGRSIGYQSLLERNMQWPDGDYLVDFAKLAGLSLDETVSLVSQSYYLPTKVLDYVRANTELLKEILK